MPRHYHFGEHRDLDPEALDALVPPSDQGATAEVAATLEAMDRLCAGELDFLVAEGRLAGLPTGVVLAVTPGGLVPLFAHVSREIFSVLVPAPTGKDPETPTRPARAGRN